MCVGIDLNVEKMSFLNFLNVNNFGNYKVDFPEKEFQCLKDCYGKYFDESTLRSELAVIFNDNDDSSIIKGLHTPLEILHYLYESELSEVLKELTKLVQLVLTIPATSVSTERSFSALKRIKNYARNTVGQNRLSDLSQLSIEKQLVKDMEKTNEWYEDIIDFFATKNGRRMEFLYK